MSYTVTCGEVSEEFSLDCKLSDVQAYFNVRGGGLHFNGAGPVVRRVYDGCAYELRGSTVSPPKHLQHINRLSLPSGKAVVTEVLWTAGEGSERSRGQKSESNTPPEGQEVIEKMERLYRDKVEELERLNIEVATKPLEWAVIGSSSICIALFFATLVWYLINYDPTQELALREHGDKMTVESITAVSLAFAFGSLGFFSS